MTLSRRKKWLVTIFLWIEHTHRHALEGSATLFIIEEAVLEQFEFGGPPLYDDELHLDTSRIHMEKFQCT